MLIILTSFLKKEAKVKVKLLSCVQLFATLWTVAHQAPPSMGFSRQEYWSGLPFPSPGDLSDPGIKGRPLSKSVFHSFIHTMNIEWSESAVHQSCTNISGYSKGYRRHPKEVNTVTQCKAEK